MQKKLSLSTGQLSEDFRHNRWRIGCMGCLLTGNLISVFSKWASGLELHVLLPLFFLLYLYVAPPTQGTWRSNGYVNALRLVDYGFVHLWSGWWSCLYTHWVVDTNVRDHACHHNPVITNPTSHLSTSRHCIFHHF